MANKLKNIIHDLQHGLFGGNISLSLIYKDNCKLYYKNELNKISDKLLEKQVISKNLIGNIYYVKIK